MKPEQTLAAAVVAHFAPAEVFQEVKSRTGATADIVVKVGPRGWIVECKMTLGLGVIWQAIRWKDYGAGIVSVAVPTPRKPYRTEIACAQRFLKHWGIGLFYVGELDRVREVFPPKLWRRKIGRHPKDWDILQECREAHKTFCPAGSQGGQWSEFKATLQRVRDLLQERGPLTMKEIVTDVETHYASTAVAKRCLHQWLQCPKVCPWAVILRVGSRLLFAAKPPEPETVTDEPKRKRRKPPAPPSIH